MEASSIFHKKESRKNSPVCLLLFLFPNFWLKDHQMAQGPKMRPPRIIFQEFFVLQNAPGPAYCTAKDNGRKVGKMEMVKRKK